MQDCNNFFRATGRRVTIEYTLLAGVNDSPTQVNAFVASAMASVLAILQAGQRRLHVYASRGSLRRCRCFCALILQFTIIGIARHLCSSELLHDGCSTDGMHGRVLAASGCVVQAQELVNLLQRHGLRSHINLIPWNPVAGLENRFERPSNNAAHRFSAVLQQAGFASTIRATRGLEASAACGQLRNISDKHLLQTA